MQDKSLKSRAERHFGSSNKKDPFVVKKEKAEKERSDHAAYLKSLRLAKQAADREAAEKAALDKAAAKPVVKTRVARAAKAS